MQINNEAPHFKELVAALEAARQARSILTHHFGKLVNIEEKHLAGLVSEADRASEEVIQSVLAKHFPEYDFYGEEESYAQDKKLSLQDHPRPIWVVDPLDGTTNYVHRFPIFCSSIGLVIKGVPVVGVVDAPILRECFYGVKGQGAYCNDKKIHVSANHLAQNALGATGFFPDDRLALEEQLRVFSKIVSQTRGIRRAGAAAYDLCMVANGVFDFFWESNLKAWDTAAGQLLVTEAGGKVTTYRGKNHVPGMNSILASNSHLHNEIVNEIAEYLRPQTS